MSVYNEAEQVQTTIQSVLAQQGVDLEFIIVSDGADAGVLDVLNSYRDDQRVIVLEQQNQGLTKALINGCDRASNELIARIDAGDTMLAGRLVRQAETLLNNSDVGMVTSWVNMCTEDGYLMYTVDLNQAQLEKGLTSESASNFVSPIHASVMFKKILYQQVGGYRQEFYFTQDCDLWSRMIERSGIRVIDAVLSNAIFSPSGISGHHQAQQTVLVKLVVQGIALRRQGLSDSLILEAAKKIHPAKNIKKKSEFESIYFIAKVLTDNRSRHAKEYWQRALRLKPWSFKARLFSVWHSVNSLITRI